MLSEVLIKEFLKFCSKNNNQVYDINYLQLNFLKQIIAFLSNQHYNIGSTVNMQRRASFNFQLKSDNIVFQHHYFLKYIFKALNIKLTHNLANQIQEDETYNVKQSLNSNDISREENNINEKKFGETPETLLKWRPKGEALVTLNPNDEPIIKLMNLDDIELDKFLSFSNKGNITLWEVNKITVKDELGNFQDQSVRAVKLSQSISSSFNYNTITHMHNKKFALANDSNQIQIYRVSNYYKDKIETPKSDLKIENTYNVSHKEITGLIPLDIEKESNCLIYCSRSGIIEVIDLRVNKPVLYHNINMQRGLITCLDINQNHK